MKRLKKLLMCVIFSQVILLAQFSLPASNNGEHLLPPQQPPIPDLNLNWNKAMLYAQASKLKSDQLLQTYKGLEKRNKVGLAYDKKIASENVTKLFEQATHFLAESVRAKYQMEEDAIIAQKNKNEKSINVTDEQYKELIDLIEQAKSALKVANQKMLENK